MPEDNFVKMVKVDEHLEVDGPSAFVGNKVPVMVMNQNCNNRRPEAYFKFNYKSGIMKFVIAIILLFTDY